VCRNLYRLFRFEEAPKLLRLPPEPPAANKSLLPPAPAASEHRSLVLPGSAAANANTLGLNPDTPGDQLYRFEALEIKELSHRLDGVLWPRQTTGCAETGSPEFPVVLLEVQMHPDSGFQHRLAAQTYRWFPQLTEAQIIVIAGIPREEIRHTRAVQDWLADWLSWLPLKESW
jgi:hypothetical protein